MYCTKCGERLPGESAFCRFCGAKVSGQRGTIRAAPAPSTAFEASLLTDTVSVEVGANADDVTVFLRNISDRVDQLNVAVDGLSPDWYRLSSEHVALFPGDESEVRLHISPPRRPDVHAGLYPTAVRISSQTEPSQCMTLPFRLEVTAPLKFAFELRPERIRGRTEARSRAVISNTGHAVCDLILSGRNPEDECRFEFARTTVNVEPGSRAEVPFVVRCNRWLKEPRTYQFVIAAAPRGAEVGVQERYGEVTLGIPFEYEVDMRPERFSGSFQAGSTVLITNTGEDACDLELRGRDPEDECTFEFSSNQVKVRPGETTQVPFEVRSRKGALTEPKAYDLRIDVAPAGGPPGAAREVCGHATLGGIRYAGFRRRALAVLIDLLLLAVPVILAVPFWAARGATPGKMLLGVKIVRVRGGHLDFRTALVRFILWLPFLFTLSLSIPLRRDCRAIHDLLADTVVIRTR